MTKRKVVRKKKTGTVKKTKARQIIKQKVVINLDKAISGARRSRKRSGGSGRRGPVAAGESFITRGKGVENQYYDQQRAALPYAEEIKKELKLLKSGQDDNIQSLLNMQKAGIMLEMNQGRLNNELNRITTSGSRPRVEILPPLQLSTEKPKGTRGGAREGAGRPKGSKSKLSDLTPMVEEIMRKKEEEAIKTQESKKAQEVAQREAKKAQEAAEREARKAQREAIKAQKEQDEAIKKAIKEQSGAGGKGKKEKKGK